jgi:hypothetical protein
LALHQQLAKLETDNLHLRLQLTGAAAGTAAPSPSGLSVGFVLASNLVSSAARAWIDGGNREPIMVLPAWGLQNPQDRAILKVMGHL